MTRTPTTAEGRKLAARIIDGNQGAAVALDQVLAAALEPAAPALEQSSEAADAAAVLRALHRRALIGARLWLAFKDAGQSGAELWRRVRAAEQAEQGAAAERTAAWHAIHGDALNLEQIAEAVAASYPEDTLGGRVARAVASEARDVWRFADSYAPEREYAGVPDAQARRLVRARRVLDLVEPSDSPRVQRARLFRLRELVAEAEAELEATLEG